MLGSVPSLLSHAVVRDGEHRAAVRVERAVAAEAAAARADKRRTRPATTSAARVAAHVRATLLHSIRRAWQQRLGRDAYAHEALVAAITASDDRLAAVLLGGGAPLGHGRRARARLLGAIASDAAMSRTANTLVEAGLLDLEAAASLEVLLAASETPHTELVRLLCTSRRVQRELAARPDAVALHTALRLRYAYWRAANYVRFDADLRHLRDVLRHVDVTGLSYAELAPILFAGDRLSELPQRRAVVLMRQLADADEAVAAAATDTYAFARCLDDVVDTFSPHLIALADQDYRAFSALAAAAVLRDNSGDQAAALASLQHLELPLDNPSTVVASMAADWHDSAAPCA